MRSMYGLTLIEVLVAVLVLGIGLVGVAGLQARALQMNTGSYQRTQATLLAESMVDRMRANSEALDQDDYDMKAGASATEDGDCSNTTGCDPEEMAENDLFEWINDVGATLPDGNAYVCTDSTPNDGTPGSEDCDGAGDALFLKVWWTDRMADGNETRLFVTEFQR